jgi:catechol 2,3-dioxygenase-like lactoylglutathione lyase family enzyme
MTFPTADMELTRLLVVSDVERSRQWYTDVLGLRIQGVRRDVLCTHFLTPPVDRGSEIRAFFRDPDGHLFEISEVSRPD